MPASPSEAGPHPAGVGALALSGARWQALSLGFQQLARLAFLALVARAVGPTDYAAVALALTYVALTSLLLDVGLSSSLIREPRLHADLIRTATAVNWALGVVVVAATCAAAELLGRVFHSPHLPGVLYLLSASTLARAVAVVPLALLERGLRYRRISAYEITSTCASLVVGAILLAGGAGYLSAVVQLVGADVLLAAALVAGGTWWGLRPQRRALRSLLGFGGPLFGSQVLNYVSRNADNIVIGPVLGPAALSFYSLSYRVMLFAVQNAGQVVNRVAFPAYARAVDDPARMRRAYLRSVRLLLGLTGPLLVLTLVSAPQVVPLVLGDRWRPAVVPLQILCVTGIRQSAQSLVWPLIMAQGRAGALLRWNALAAAAYVTSFLVGVHWGIVGVALAYTVAGLILSPVPALMARRACGAAVAAQLRAAGPAAVGSAVAACAYEAVRLALHAVGMSWSTWAGLAGAVVACAAALRLRFPGTWAELRAAVAGGGGVAWTR